MAILTAGDADFYQFTLSEHAFQLGDKGDGGTFAADLKGVRHGLAETAELGALGASEGSRRHSSRHDTCDGQGEDLKKRVFSPASPVGSFCPRGLVRNARDFERPALDGVVRWKFRPGMKLGRKVNTRVIQPIDLALMMENSPRPYDTARATRGLPVGKCPGR